MIFRLGMLKARSANSQWELEIFLSVETAYFFVTVCCKNLKIVEIRERRKSVNIPMLVHIRQKLPLVSTFKIILGIYINHFPEPFSVYVCGVCV